MCMETFLYLSICIYIKLNVMNTLRIYLQSFWTCRPDIVTCFFSLYRFQKFLYFICAFQNISCGIHYLASVFLTVSPYHTCRPPGNVSQVLFGNISIWRLEDIWILFFTGHKDQIIVQLQNGEVWELTSCHRFRRDDNSVLNSDYNGQKSSFPCMDGYIYDKSKWDSTVVTQWDLVCNREWYAKMVQPVFMVGVLLGAMIFGHFSDR